ncbi:MAG TPA: hypothetical protein DEP35_10795 [Deltaproteobacteria bacterium]|nr:hypothetical protein [Deltaproteobacteria bacterium]
MPTFFPLIAHASFSPKAPGRFLTFHEQKEYCGRNLRLDVEQAQKSPVAGRFNAEGGDKR